MEAVKLGKPPFVAAALRVRQLIASLAQKHLAQSAILPPPLLSEPRAHNAEVERVVNSFAVQKATAVSLTDLYRFGLEPTAAQCVRNAQFLHHELPIRFAQRCVLCKCSRRQVALSPPSFPSPPLAFGASAEWWT
mmetsp:Transcript_15770/g.60013  ORF Transcript_15770/g.60013 Transcript_15770/m.60013 type:complete len:135 (+) Transcript_15770:95-499(+)